MDTQYRQGMAALAALIFTTDAMAEWRCDCTSIVASCQAEAVTHESFVEVTTDVAQCARVDYFIDGLPFIALVVDGKERQDWIAQSESPDIIVQSCQVCLDSTRSAAGTAQPESIAISTDAASAQPQRLIVTEPAYPPAAMAAGVEGFVDVRFSLSEIGTVIAPEVILAEPANVFDAAALATVGRWRYSVNASSAGQLITERVDFRLADAIMSLAPAESSIEEPAIGPATPRSNCLREQNRFDLGPRVDISLVNVCTDPLIVFACTVGTGSDRNRWVCRDPERAASGINLTSEAAALASSQRLELSRAPNSEYWWLACGADDAGCLVAARQWRRDLDGLSAAVDPQARTRSRLSRSY